MGQSRSDLQDLFETFVNDVYFQPPDGMAIKYPCIIYKRDDEDVKHANDKPYSLTTAYMVTIIDRNPDSEIPKKIASLPLSRFDRFYVTESLNHNVYKVYF